MEQSALAASTPTTASRSHYDVLVIGGGTAGLSAALVLSRARRSVLVVDAGAPRNAPADHVHNYLGREGMAPADLAAQGRAEVRGYGGEVVSGNVTAATPAPAGGFEVDLADGQRLHARRLLVATGLIDELPEVPGLAEQWGRGIVHCPYCHGWEIRDQAVAVLGSGPFAVHQALMFRQWSADVTLVRHTAPTPDADQREQLAARGIVLVEEEVTAVESSDDRITGLRLRSGALVAAQAVTVTPRFVARTEALTGLGLEASDQQFGGTSIGSFIAADPTGATSVPGVWVAGNVAELSATVINSAAAGMTTAAAINADLTAEDNRAALDRHRSGAEPAART